MGKKKDILRITYEQDKDNNGGMWIGIIGILLGYIIVFYNEINPIHAYMLGLFNGMLFIIYLMLDEKFKKLDKKK